MKKLSHYFFTCIVVLLLSFLISCTQNEQANENSRNIEEVKKELSILYSDFFDAWKIGDLEKCLSFMAEGDYINMPSLDATQNFDETRTLFQDVIAQNTIADYNYRQSEIFIHSDMAYEFGELDQTWIVKETNDTLNLHTRCITVWKKLEDTGWKLHRWMAQ